MFLVRLKCALKSIHYEDVGLALNFIINRLFNLFGEQLTHYNMEIRMHATLDHSC